VTNTVGNVLQGAPVTTGGVLIDLVGTATLPTTATATATGFTALGYVGEEGLTETINRTTDKIKAWGGDVVKVTQSEFSVTYGFTLYETQNANVLKAVFGSANVTSTPGDTDQGTLQAVKVNSTTRAKLPMVFDMVDGLARIRLVVPAGQVSLSGDLTYTDAGVVGYPCTVEAFADGSGNQAYHYLDDGVFIP